MPALPAVRPISCPFPWTGPSSGHDPLHRNPHSIVRRASKRLRWRAYGKDPPRDTTSPKRLHAATAHSPVNGTTRRSCFQAIPPCVPGLRHPAGATRPPIDWSPSERSGATRLCIRCACAAAAHPTSRFKTAKPSSHPLRRKVDQVLPTPRTGFGCSAQCGVQATTVISEARHSNRASPRRKPHRR